MAARYVFDVKNVPIRVAGFASMIFPRSPAQLKLCAIVFMERPTRFSVNISSLERHRVERRW